MTDQREGADRALLDEATAVQRFDDGTILWSGEAYGVHVEQRYDQTLYVQPVVVAPVDGRGFIGVNLVDAAGTPVAGRRFLTIDAPPDEVDHA